MDPARIFGRELDPRPGIREQPRPKAGIDDSERVRSILRLPPQNERSARSRLGPMRLRASGAGLGFERHVGGALGYFTRFRKP